MRYGVATARRGWLTPEQVANTRTWDELDRLRKRSKRSAVRGQRSSRLATQVFWPARAAYRASDTRALGSASSAATAACGSTSELHAVALLDRHHRRELWRASRARRAARSPWPPPAPAARGRPTRARDDRQHGERPEPVEDHAPRARPPGSIGVLRASASRRRDALGDAHAPPHTEPDQRGRRPTSRARSRSASSSSFEAAPTIETIREHGGRRRRTAAPPCAGSRGSASGGGERREHRADSPARRPPPGPPARRSPPAPRRSGPPRARRRSSTAVGDQRVERVEGVEVGRVVAAEHARPRAGQRSTSSRTARPLSIGTGGRISSTLRPQCVREARRLGGSLAISLRRADGRPPRPARRASGRR